MNDAKSNPWAEIKRLQAENANLHFLIEQANGAMAELRGNYDRVRAAFENQTIECNNLRNQLAKAYGEFQSNLQIEINRTFEAMERYGEAKAQLAATEEALQQVQRESAELREDRDFNRQRVIELQRESAELREERDGMRNLTVEECATIAKEAAERVSSWDMRSIANHIENKIRALTNPNYRLAEPSEVDEKEDGLGFFPGFPPGFDVKRAEKGLAQDRGEQGTASASTETAAG